MTPLELVAFYQGMVENKYIQVRQGDRWIGGGYSEFIGPNLDTPSDKYRIKPETKILYTNEYFGGNGGVYTTEAEARHNAGKHAIRTAVKYQEVVD